MSSKYKELVIGIDQSYKNTGISIAADGKILKITSLHLEHLKTNKDKRRYISQKLQSIVPKMLPKADNVVCLLERIRLRSDGFISVDYIKAMAALNAIISDICGDYGVTVYSVDTRSWKAQVIGTSKPAANKRGVPPEKWPTIKWVIKQGFEESILVEVKNPRKQKGTFMKNGVKYQYNDDAADSAGIAMYWFLGEKDKLKEEH